MKTDTLKDSLPFVSIIIPVYNDKRALDNIVSALRLQSYPKVKYEVIVVDNGSDLEISADEKNDIIYLKENRYLGSPYSARNRGIEKSRGEILAFLDATNIPNNNWLQNGVKCLTKNCYDLMGGDVKFRYSEQPTVAEIYDSLVNINMKFSIQEKGRAKTANLFVRRPLVNEIGMFIEGVRSGEDVRWTSYAVNSGFKIGFCQDSVVYKPARKFRALLKKQWRVGLAQPKIWRELNDNFWYMLARGIAPIGPNGVRNLLIKRGKSLKGSEILKILIIANFLKIVMFFANLAGKTRITFRGSEKENDHLIK